MPASTHEKLSLLCDEQLSAEQAISLAKSLRSDAALQATLQRYQFIGEAIKHDAPIKLRSDFASTIHEAIADEPAYLLPRKPVHVVKPLKMVQHVGMAVAASLTLAIALGLSLETKPTSRFEQLAKHQATEMVATAVNPRLNDYLQAHGNAVYINSRASDSPYLQNASYRSQ
jgi:sigma-E factor negative regulatory protein RseA